MVEVLKVNEHHIKTEQNKYLIKHVNGEDFNQKFIKQCFQNVAKDTFSQVLSEKKHQKLDERTELFHIIIIKV